MSTLDPCRSHTRYRNESLRWYLAALVFMLSFVMGFLWNLFNALSTISERILGISEQSIEYDVMIGSAVLVLAAPFVAYIIDTDRFREAMIFSSFCSCLGSWVIVAGVVKANEWIIFSGLALNGLSGPMAMFGGAALSDLWFPPHQRTQATSLLCLANYIGVGFAFFIGASVVQENDGIDKFIHLTIAIATITTTVLVCTVMKFPSAPESPVSCSQNFRQLAKHIDVLSQYISLFKSWDFLRIFFCYGLGSGLYAGWGGSLNENLASYGLDQANSGWIGMMSLMGGFFGGTVGSVLVDRRQVSLQNMALVLFYISSAACGLFIVGCYLKWPLIALIAIATVIGAGINGTIPILFELALETTFPIPNAAIGNLLTAVNGLGAVVFLCVPIEAVGAQWMNWVPFLACLSSIPILSYGRIQCRRSEVDSQGLTASLLENKLRDDD